MFVKQRQDQIPKQYEFCVVIVKRLAPVPGRWSFGWSLRFILGGSAVLAENPFHFTGPPIKAIYVCPSGWRTRHEFVSKEPNGGYCRSDSKYQDQPERAHSFAGVFWACCFGGVESIRRSTSSVFMGLGDVVLLS